MTEQQPDLVKALGQHKDPFLHGEGEEWDEIFKGEEPSFSRGFYAEQAAEVRAKRAAESDCAECADANDAALRADQALRGISWRRA